MDDILEPDEQLEANYDWNVDTEEPCCGIARYYTPDRAPICLKDAKAITKLVREGFRANVGMALFVQAQPKAGLTLFKSFLKCGWKVLAHFYNTNSNNYVTMFGLPVGTRAEARQAARAWRRHRDV